jgi:transposase
VETVSAWFVAHPGVELISRDGSSEYAAAALKGAPQAVQVADKWHILKNLRKALAVLLTPHLTAYRKKKTPQSGTQKESTFPQDQARRLSPQQTRIQHLHRQERLARYEQVVALAKQGMKRRAIADQVGVGLTPIQNWLKAGSFPERKPREQSSQLDPYRPYVEKRRSEGYHNLMGIYRELRAQGYRGSYETMYAQFAHSSQSDRSKQASSSSLTHALPSSQQAACLFLRRAEDVTAEEQATILRLRRLHPEVELAYTFVQPFTQLLRTRTGEQLDGWLQAVASSPLTDLQSFVGSVYEDKEATLAGLTREESNGPTEGHITRLKLIKRSMYGRAKFDLLRLRVLSHPQKAQDAKTQADHKQREEHGRKLKAGQITPILQHTTFGSSEVA